MSLFFRIYELEYFSPFVENPSIVEQFFHQMLCDCACQPVRKPVSWTLCRVVLIFHHVFHGEEVVLAFFAPSCKIVTLHKHFQSVGSSVVGKLEVSHFHGVLGEFLYVVEGGASIRVGIISVSTTIPCPEMNRYYSTGVGSFQGQSGKLITEVVDGNHLYSLVHPVALVSGINHQQLLEVEISQRELHGLRENQGVGVIVFYAAKPPLALVNQV